MDDPACRAIAAQIADLERHVEFLEDLLSDPELTPLQRASIRRQIATTRDRIADLREELAECQSPLRIAGIEKTQATQFFSFNGQGSGAAPDNSVPLVAQRTTILRVYVDYRRGAGQLPRPVPPGPTLPTHVSGRVVVDRIRSDGSLTRLATLTPINNQIVAGPAEAIDRGDPNHTLNFRVGGNDCQGLLRFTVTVFEQGPVVVEDVALTTTASADVERGISPTALRSASTAVTMQTYGRFDPLPAFRVHAVLVHYTGGGVDLPAPTGFDFAETLEYVLRTYPIGRLEFEDCIEIDFDKDLGVPGGGCGPGFEGPGGLMGILKAIDDASDRPAIRVALIPAGATTSVGGCGNKNIAAAKDGAGTTLAQEMGHALDRKHAPAGGAPGPDPNYPDYDEYPSGSIGEYGFDIVTSEVYDPNSSSDFMSYGSNRWVSPYTYMGLRNTIIERFGDESARTRRFERTAQDAREEALFLSFAIQRDGHVDVQPSFHIPVARPEPAHGSVSDVACELLDEHGEVLAFHRCRVLGPDVEPHAASISFQERIPWFEQTTAIRFLRGSDVLHVHEVEARAPDVELSTQVRSVGKGVELEWKGEHPERDVTYLVRYSRDDGRTWRVLAVTDSVSRVLKRVPGGDRCLAQIVASSGIRTSVATSKPFSVPTEPRQALILTPAETDVPVLRGAAFSSDHGLASPDDVVWTSNVDGFLGRGFELILDDLSEGTHTISLSAPDGEGGLATASTTLRLPVSTSRPLPARS
jgi:hypothetical protein